MSRFGSSPTLDQDWDFTVDTTGDIQCSNQLGYDIAELEKDLAFTIASRLNIELGNRKAPAQQANIKKIVRSVVNRDPRIQRLDSLSVEDIDSDEFEGYRITMVVSGAEESIGEPLIIEV